MNADATSGAAMDAVRYLREEAAPLVEAVAPVEVMVGGVPALYTDAIEMIEAFTPWVIAVVLGLSFVLLLVAFRSLVIAVQAIVMNLLSVGASYGLVTLVFQQGVGADLLGFTEVERILAWLPLLMFCVLFGLSMDYHIFLLSRIREHYDQTGDTSEAVVFGVGSTGGIITGAAAIMVAVFAGMAMGDMAIFQQLGLRACAGDRHRRDHRAHRHRAVGHDPVGSRVLVPAALVAVAAQGTHRGEGAPGTPAGGRRRARPGLGSSGRGRCGGRSRE